MTVCKSNHFATYLDKTKLEKTVSSIETHILLFLFFQRQSPEKPERRFRKMKRRKKKS